MQAKEFCVPIDERQSEQTKHRAKLTFLFLTWAAAFMMFQLRTWFFSIQNVYVCNKLELSAATRSWWASCMFGEVWNHGWGWPQRHYIVTPPLLPLHPKSEKNAQFCLAWPKTMCCLPCDVRYINMQNRDSDSFLLANSFCLKTKHSSGFGFTTWSIERQHPLPVQQLLFHTWCADWLFQRTSLFEGVQPMIVLSKRRHIWPLRCITPFCVIIPQHSDQAQIWICFVSHCWFKVQPIVQPRPPQDISVILVC